MFSFDGQYKRRRAVSLGGASKKEGRSSLLQRVRARRKEREDKNYTTNCDATTVQSIFRGKRVRCQQYELQRISFDEAISSLEGSKDTPTADAIRNMLRKLLFFYSDSKDTQRLIWMCQFLLENRNTVQKLQTSDHQIWLHQIKCLLLICGRSLETSMRDSQPVPIQLPMLKVFTSDKPYYNPTDPARSRKDAAMVTVYLVRNGYFRYLRVLLNARVPSSLEPSTVSPTPMAAAIRDLVMNPLYFSSQSSSGEESAFTVNDRHAVFSAFISDILCPEMTKQIVCFLLPSIADQSARFCFSQLLETLLKLLTKADESGGANSKIAPTPWLLYGVLAFVKTHLGSTSALSLVKCYIQVLEILIVQLPHPVSRGSDDESDSNSEMETDSSQLSLEDLKEKCLDILNSDDHVKTLESLFARHKKKDYEKGVIRALCSICHFLGRLPRHRARLLHTLAQKQTIVKELWTYVQSVTVFTNTGKETLLLDLICCGIDLSTQEASAVTLMLSLMSILLSNGQRDSSMIFSDKEMKHMSSVLCDVVKGIIKIIYPYGSQAFTRQRLAALKSVGAKSALMKKDEFYPKEKWIKLLKDVSCLVRRLHSRDSRRQLCSEGHWLSHEVNIDPAQMRIDGFLNEGTVEGVLEPGLSTSTARNMAILQYIPFVVPFPDREKLLQRIVAKSRLDSQGEPHNFMMGPAIDVTVNRTYIYQHAFDQLTKDKAPNLRQKLRVRMINAQGLEEAGVDGGGISR
ncbi:unnamed protein product [Pocillopora meandrina]|uniref:HECT-type E3 ubiquitin transferase n=1 Tax=Pocillopora meandrina TaxID=46732 RepID=A0AAU9WJQ4_9CNID|nr:unnamed protein product [Pocillopora meandrina]